MNFYSDLNDNIEQLKDAGAYRFLKDTAVKGKYINIGTENLINISSNDYLGFAYDTDLIKEFWSKNKCEDLFFSSASSRLLGGNLPEYSQLENKLKTLYNKPNCLVFNSGYHANIGILSAILKKGDLIIADKLVHASIIDGIRLSQVDFERYRHLDFNHLEQLLKKHRNQYKNIVIVTESIFSMDGDIANIKELVEIKKKYNALLYVDEAHAFGVRGEKGLGCCEEQALIQDIDVLVGTFGKAAASVGAFVVCNDVLRETLVNQMRSLIYTTALPPINLAWTSFIVDKITESNDLRIHLQTISDKLRNAIIEKSYTSLGQTNIVPLICGSNFAAIEMSNKIISKGFYALPIKSPTVAKGSERVRFSVSAALTEEDIDKLCSVI